MNSAARPSDKGVAAVSLCDCKVNCCLHAYAESMLEMLYRYAAECAECEGSGRRQVGEYDDGHEEDCGACADIRELIRRVDPCGDRLTRAERPQREAQEPQEDDIAF